MRLVCSAYLVREYEEAIDWFVGILGWWLVENSDLGGGKRWVRVAAAGGNELLLARAASPEQTAAIGNAAGGRVAYFLHSDDFDSDFSRLIAARVTFVENPRDEDYGRVAVFLDLYGNKWDLIAPRPPSAGPVGEI